MDIAPVEILQQLTIFAVEARDGEIEVDLYGGDESVCGWIVYRFDDWAELDRHARTLRTWMENGTRVTYVRRGDIVQLVYEVAYLEDIRGLS